MIPDARVLYAQAFRERFAVPAFNVCNLEMAQGAVEAAEADEAPVILQTYPGDLAHGGASLSALLRTMAEASSAPVVLHLDHGEGLEMIAGRLRVGYSSVMFDGSHLGLEENIRQTRLMADVAHAFSASLEAEIGLFGGDHGSVVFTDPVEAERFVSESGADTLAVSVGSEHHKESRLDLERLEDISTRTGHPMVLHGGSGIHPDDVKAAARIGVVKINIGHAISVAMNEGAKEALEAGLDHYAMLKVMREKVRDRAVEKIRLMGASGAAGPATA